MINDRETITTSPLAFKEIEMPEWVGRDPNGPDAWKRKMRVMFFDPTEIYVRADKLIDRYSRTQSRLNLEIMFPKRTDGLCRCGCGNKAKRLWHSKHCSNFALSIYYIIAYGTAQARPYIETYHGAHCAKCGGSGCEIDHIIPVKHGGGGCWLSNFIPLCSTCHKDKTKRDFGWAEYKLQA